MKKTMQVMAVLAVATTLFIVFCFPETDPSISIPLVYGCYVVMMLLSLVKNKKLTAIFLVCAAIMPLIDPVWNSIYFGFNDAMANSESHILLFAFFGKFSYVLFSLILPVSLAVIAEIIRQPTEGKEATTA